MQQNLFFPVYKQLEKELNELSYFITFDKKQLKTYSIVDANFRWQCKDLVACL